MPNTQNATVNTDLLKSQIEGLTNFNIELTPGASSKKIMADLGAKSRDLYQVKPADIVVLDGFNPRVKNQAYYDGIEILAQDMVKHGFMQDKPLAGYSSKVEGKDVIVLQDGHRRHMAVLRANEIGAKILTVPLVLKERGQNMVDLTLGLLHSNEGQPFNTYEKAIIAKRLKNYGWENKQIAEEMRCTTAFVGQLLTLAGSSEAIQELVRTGQMAATAAIDLIKEHGSGAAGVAKEMVGTAKKQGKKKATAKDNADAALIRRAKAVGYKLYEAFAKVWDDKAIMKIIDKDLFGEIDTLLFNIENGKPVKEKKAPKVKAEKKAKVVKAKAAPKAKKVPLAKKVATAKKPKAAAKPKHAAPWDKGAEGAGASA